MKINAYAVVFLTLMLDVEGHLRKTTEKQSIKSSGNRQLSSSSTQNSRWASSGGGWRAMAADMAYANVFYQAGVIDDTSTVLSGISTESGGSWFSTQFFYSPEFNENITTSSPEELSNFVLQWMDSYETFTKELTQNPQCDFLDEFNNIAPLETLKDYCNIFVDFDGDWAAFVEGMMETASKDYGDDSLVNKSMNSANRVGGMSNTELYVQTSLVPNSRIRSESEGVFLGPSAGSDISEIYSLPVCVQYTVTNDETFFYSTVEGGTLQLDVNNDAISNDFNYPTSFKEFGLFPADNQTVLISSLKGSANGGSMATPFGSSPNVAQMAAASSAAIGNLSPLVPSTLSQYLSVSRESLKEGSSIAELTAYDQAIDELYNMNILDDLAVCSQWPNDCGKNDGRFIDGTFTDGPTLALNIGQYQSRANGDNTEKLKVIVTLNNNYLYGPETVLAYFNTTFNQDVEPGDFLWPINYTDNFNLPLQSPQIFNHILDEDTFESLTQPIDGLNVTTTVIKGVETLENPAFHTKAGQTVDVMVLSLNSNIPTKVIGIPLIEEYKQPLTDLANGIASSKELVDRVKNFFFDD